MRRMIRHKATRAFFVHGKWTENATLAEEFPGLKEVDEARRMFKLQNVEMYYQIGKEISADYDFTLPLT